MSPVTFPTNFLIQPPQSQPGTQFQFLSGQPAMNTRSTTLKLTTKAVGNSTTKATKAAAPAPAADSRPTQFERFRRKFISPLVAPKDKFPDYCRKKLFRSLPVECRSRLESFNFNFG